MTGIGGLVSQKKQKIKMVKKIKEWIDLWVDGKRE